jgi:heat shock protein HslJ
MKRIIVLFTLAGVLLAACAPAASPSIAGEWTLVSYGEPASPTSAAPDIETSIVFGNDGKVNGSAGCNTFGGDYTVGDDTLTFGALASTLMFCEGAAGEQETVLYTVFVDTASFVLDGDMLTVTSADGSAMVVLARK